MADTISTAELQTAMLSATNAVKDFGTNVNNTNSEFANMIAEIKKLNKAFQDEFNATKKYLDDIVNAAKGKSKKGLRVEDREVKRILDKIFKCVCTDGKKISGKNKGNSSNKGSDPQKNVEQFNKKFQKDIDKAENGVEKTIREYEEKQRKYAESRFIIEKFNLLQNAAKQTEKIFFGMGEKAQDFSEMFNPLKMMSDEQQFNRELRQTAYEVAGVTGESVGLQKAMADIGTTVSETGKTRSEFQKEYIDNLKAGISDTKTLNRLTKQSLGTERMLGLEAGELTEHFRKLNMQGRATVEQTAAIGRGMVNVARSTGLTGKHLVAAVNASEDLNKQLQNTANFTASAANNILEIVANSQKLGVEGKAKEILEMATSTNKLLESNNNATQTFLIQSAAKVGKIRELQYGIITRSRKGLKELSDGMMGVLQRFGVESLEAIENLSDEKKFKLNIQLKAAFGMELGEVTRVVDSFQKASKGYVEKLGEINKKQQQNLNIEEKKAALEEQRKLKASAAMEVVTALSEATRGAKDMSQALANFDRRKGEFTDNMKAIGGDLTNTTQGVGFAYQTAAEQLNTRLKELGKEPITIDGADIEKALQDKDAQKILNERLEKGFAMLQQAEKNSTDPMTQVEQTLKGYNDYFRNDYGGPAIQYLTAIAGFTGLMSIALTGIAANFAGLALGKAAALGKGLSGGAGAAGAASGAAGAAGSAAPAASAASGLAGASPTGMLDKINWGSMKTVLGKAALGIAGIVAVIGMIAVALVALSVMASIVTKTFKIDPLKLAIDVSKILIAATVIGAEVIAAYLALHTVMNAFSAAFTKSSMVAVGKFAIKLILMTIAVTALATAIIWMSNKLTFGLTGKEALQVAETVTTIIFAASVISAAVISAFLGLVGAGVGLAALSSTIATTWPFILLATVLLPFLAMGMVNLAGAIVGVCAKVLKSMDIDRKTIEETVYGITILFWGLAGIVVALAAAAAAVVGLGGMIALVSLIPGGSKAILKAVALMAGLGYVMYKIYSWLKEFIDSFKGVDPEEMKADIKKAKDYLQGMNDVLLHMLPVFAFIIGMGVLFAYMQKMYGGKFLLQSIVYGLIFAALLTFIGPMLFKMASGVVNAITNMVKKIDFNAEALKANTEKAVAILDAFNKIMIRLAPALIGIVALGYLMSKIPIKELLIAAGIAAAIALVLPIAAGAIMALAIATVKIVEFLVSGVTLGKTNTEEMLAKLDNLVSLIWGIGTTALLLTASFTYAFGTMLACMVPMLMFSGMFFLFSSKLAVVIKELTNLNNAFGDMTSKVMEDFNKKLLLLSQSIKNLAGAISQIKSSASEFTGGWFGSTGITVLNDFARILFELKEPISKVLEQINAIGLLAYSSSLSGDPEKLAKSFESVAKMTKSVMQFMSDMSKIKPPKQGALNKMTNGTQDVEQTLQKHFRAVQKIIEMPKKLKITKSSMKKGNETMQMVSDSMKMFGSIMVELEKTFKTIEAINKSGIKTEELSTKIDGIMEQILSTVDTIIGKAAAREKEFDAEAFIDTVNQMSKIGQVMSLLAPAIENFGKSVEQIQALQGTSWWGLATGNGLDKFNKEMKDGQPQRSEFEKQLESLFSGITSIIEAVDAAVKSEILQKARIDEIVYKLGLLSNLLDNAFKAIGNFASKARELFKTGFMGFGKGDGAWAGEYGGVIRESIRSIFESIKLLLLEIITIQEDPTWKKAEKSIDEVNKNIINLHNLLTKMSQNLQTFIGGLRTNFSFMAPEKGMFTRSGGDYTKFNKIMTDIDETLTNIGMILRQIVNTVDKEIASQVKSIENSTSILQKVKPLLETFVSVLVATASIWETILERKGLHFGGKDLEMFAEKIVGMTLRSVAAITNAVVKEIQKISIMDSGMAMGKLKLIESMIVPLTNFLEFFSQQATPLTTAVDAAGKARTDIIIESAKKIEDAMSGVVGLFLSVQRQVKRLPAGDGLKEAQEKMKGMGDLLQGVIGILEATDKTMSILVDENSVDAQFVGQVTKILKNLDKANPIKDVFVMINKAIIAPLKGLNLKPKEVKEAGDLLTGLQNVTSAVASIIKSLAMTMRGNVSGKKSFLKVATENLNKENTAAIVEIIKAVASFITPIKALGIKGKHAEDAAKVITSAAQILTVLGGEPGVKAGLIAYLATAVRGMTEGVKNGEQVGPSQIQTAKDAISSFATTFELLAPELAKVVKAVAGIGYFRYVEGAGKTLLGVRNILEALGGGEEGNLISFINTQIQKITAGGGGPVPTSLVEKAGQTIGSLAKQLPTILMPMGELIKAIYQHLGRARNVKVAAASLAELPTMFAAVEEVIPPLQSLQNIQFEEGDGLENLEAAFASLEGFIKVLDVNYIQTLTEDTYAAVNELTNLDEALLALIDAFACIGSNMQELGVIGTKLSGNGAVNVQTTNQVTANTVPGQTSPDGGTLKKIALSSFNFAKDNIGVIAALQENNSMLATLASAMDNSNGHLEAIQGGVTGERIVKAVKIVHKASKFTNLASKATNMLNGPQINGGLNRGGGE